MGKRGPVTRDTKFPADCGSWDVKGKTLDELPDNFLEWYAEEGKFDDWREACELELRRRRNEIGSPPQGGSAVSPKPAAPSLLPAKQILDNYVIAYDYIWNALARLEHDVVEPEYVRGIYGLARSAGKLAAARGLDLRAEIAPLLDRMRKSGTPQQERKRNGDLPF